MSGYPVDRRDFLKGTGALGALAVAGGGLEALLAACGNEAQTGSTTTGQPVRGGSINVATVDTPVNMDPHDAQLYSSIQVYHNIFSRLIEIDANFKYHPSLATKWTQDDARTWTVDLVENAVFHNGEPMTANDVKFSFERVKEHPNAIFLSAFQSTEVVSPYKVRFHMNAPFGAFEGALAAFSDIVNQKAVTTSDPKQTPVGTGPFKMTEWVRNDHVTLERFDKYFDKGLPYLDKVVFKAIGDDSVRLTGLRTGELSWIQRVPPQQAPSLESSASLKNSPKKPYLPDLILFNCSKPPFNDQRVRQAVAWAIDRSQIAKLVYFTEGSPATEAVSPPNPWYSGADPYKGAPDPEKSKALLKQAGIQDLRINFAGQANLPSQIRTGEVLKSQLAKAGITMEIQNYAAAQWFEALAGKSYDLTSTYWSVTHDPAFCYYPLCNSKSPWNFAGFKSDAVDAVLQKFVFSTDEQARKSAYPEVVRAVAEAAPIIFIDNELQHYWMKPTVSGPVPLPTLDIRMTDVWAKH
jgi:peptide/nickel transport system substrate-binding protein